MSSLIAPNEALYQGEQILPIMPVCEHFAGNEKLIKKAFSLQQSLGPIFDISCDCEDGAQSGQEAEHAKMIASMINSDDNRYNRVGVRIHGYEHPSWQKDLDILIPEAGEKIAYITIPKANSANDVLEISSYIQQLCEKNAIKRNIDLHVLIETHSALKNVWEIASIENVKVLDFGMMDFVSAHQGAIPAEAMYGEKQFSHPLLARAKLEISAAAAANGALASHNVSLDFKNKQQTYDDAFQAKHGFGYLRMWSVHPDQIEPIVKAMSPNLSELGDAIAILIKAQDNQWGPISHKDSLHDKATYRYYWQLLQAAYQAKLELANDIVERFFPAND